MISGALYAKLKQRQRMLDDAIAGKFQILVVAEQSRLGRGSLFETGFIMEQFEEAGVRIISRTEGEVSTRGEQGVMTAFRGYKDAAVITDTAKRVYPKMKDRAIAGFSTGQKIYGYTSVPTGPKGDWKRFVIEPTQAATMRRIFSMYVDGLGAKN